MWPDSVKTKFSKTFSTIGSPSRYVNSLIEHTSTARGQLEFGFLIICIWVAITAAIYYMTGFYFPSLTVLFVLLFGICSNFITAVSLSLFISFFYEHMYVTPETGAASDVVTFDHILVILLIAFVAGIIGRLMRGTIVEQSMLRRDAETAWRAAVKQTNLLASSESRLRTLNLTLEARVAQRTSELRGIIKHSPVAIFTRDTAGHIKLANEEFEKFVGKSRQEIIGRVDREILPLELWESIQEIDAKIKSSRTSCSIEQTLEYVQDDKVFYYIGFPIFNVAQEVEAVGGIIKDMTDRKRIEREKSELVLRERLANEASRLKSEFLANMSHEIRTPINGIIGMTKLLSETNLTSEQKRLLRTVESSSSVLLATINDILDLSKIEAGRLDLEEVTFNLKDFLLDVTECYEPLITAKGLKFKSPSVEIENTWLIGDPGRTRQVLNNLLSNALKFTSSGWIELNCQTHDRSDGGLDVEFGVSDSGMGISLEVQTKLFQKFSQGDASTARKFGGTGLGLAICKRIVERMGGSITVRSEPGQGAKFVFSIRAGRPHEATLPKAPEPISLAEARIIDPRLRRSKRVLIAEDNPINQEITLRMLEKSGYQAQAVANGSEVLELLASTHFDLILMDCQMPEMDGYEATREIRRKGNAIPIIALTACAFQYDRDKCLAAGMSDFVAKPVTKEHLIRSVDRWIAQANTTKPAPQPEPSTSNSYDDIEVLDLSMISRLEQLDKDGSHGLVKKLINMYTQSAPATISEIKTLSKLPEPQPQLRKIAHTFKSSSANLGARRVAALLQQIENGDLKNAELANVVTILEREALTVQQLLRDLLENKNKDPHYTETPPDYLEIVH